MILPDHEIRHRLTDPDDDFAVEPADLDRQLQPASLDIRLGTKFMGLPPGDVIDVTRPGDLVNGVEYDVGDMVTLGADDFLLASTLEHVTMPDDLLGRVEGRSSIGRLSVEVHSTAGIIDPGFEGEITLELSVNSDKDILLQTGMRIGQLTFTQLTSPCERPYGAERGSKYQHQTGPTGSRIDQDPELAGE